MFVKDLCTIREEVTDVEHAIAAVGSRDKKKAEGFIADFCPHGGPAQQQCLVKTAPQALGSYEEVFGHKVGL
jgi:hypothetical protein